MAPLQQRPACTTASHLPCPFLHRVLGLLGEAERLYQGLEDAQGACHCRYLRALVHDALGHSAERDADAAAALECGAAPLLSDLP